MDGWLSEHTHTHTHTHTPLQRASITCLLIDSYKLTSHMRRVVVAGPGSRAHTEHVLRERLCTTSRPEDLKMCQLVGIRK